VRDGTEQNVRRQMARPAKLQDGQVLLRVAAGLLVTGLAVLFLSRCY
jgi:hypothetical protein